MYAIRSYYVEALMALPTSTIEQVATPVDKTPSPIPAFTATITQHDIIISNGATHWRKPSYNFV